MKKLTVYILACLLFAAVLCFAAQAQPGTGWNKSEGKWYYYTASGEMARSQWLKSGETLFWMNENGEMVTEVWVERGDQWYYMTASGAAAAGWQEIDGKWYYFDTETNVMATNTTIGSWYVGEDGAWVPQD